MKPLLMLILELSWRRWSLYGTKGSHIFCLMCPLISSVGTTIYMFSKKKQKKKTKAVKEGALNRDSLIKQGFFCLFFLHVFPRSEGKVPRVPASTLNDTPAAQLSGEARFTKHGEQRRKKHKKTKNTFRLSSAASLIFDAPMVQTCFVSTPFVAPRKWKCEEKQRKMRQPTVGGGDGTETREHWGRFHTNSWRREVEHLINMPSAV